ncbi:hypothetical protein [Shewanella waksmanii]|uniref:hypothetical protein n=1 Tax=Shewanella waksmanii TaxID=213783 RepID=UPI0037367AD8
MKTITLFATLALSSSLYAADISDIDNAVNHMAIDQLQTMAEQSQGYEQAYANYRLAISANVMGNNATAQKAIDAAQQTLEALSAANDDSEALVLLAATYGMQIGLNPQQGSSYGGKIYTALKTAETLDPNNPRLILVKAINAYTTPAAYGGSKQNSIALTSKAIELFAQPCDNICWGHAEAFTWRGLAKQDLGDNTGAAADWNKAIEVESGYGWANFLLQQNQSLSVKN